MSIRDLVVAATTGKQIHKVDVPGLGEVYLRALSAAEFDKLMSGVKLQHGGDIQRKSNWRAWLVSQALAEEDGSRVFGDGEEAFLGQLSSGTIQFLYDRFCAMNGLGKNAVEELEKNSNGMHDADLPSDLHLS